MFIQSLNSLVERKNLVDTTHFKFPWSMEKLVKDLSEFLISPITLSNAGMLILQESEVEVKCEDDVSLLEHKNKKAGRELVAAGMVVLTNLRVVLISKKVGWGVNLSDILNAEDCTSSYFGRSTRINFQLRGGALNIGLKFQSANSDKSNFLQQTQHFLSKKSWIVIKKLADPAVEPTFSANNAGVAGILRRQEQNLKSVDTLARDAMVDLDSLMIRAKEMAIIVQRYASYAGERVEGDNSDRSETTTETGETNEIDSILQSMGIASPVTKYSAGRLYHKQLARQLADFLLESNRLSRMGGMMTLTDSYGIFNRARGTELVSPDDFLQSARMLEKLGVGISLKDFPSGVSMLRLDSLNEESLCKSLVELFNSDEIEILEEGIQASLVAQRFNLSIVLAKEILLIAENRELLSRDDSLGGLSFFLNKFKDIV